jgi:hypothetical protein
MRRRNAVAAGVAAVLVLAALLLSTRGDRPPAGPDDGTGDASPHAPPASAAGLAPSAAPAVPSREGAPPEPAPGPTAPKSRPGPRKVVLEGRVVGLKGEAVAGATLHLLRFPVRRAAPFVESLDGVFDLMSGGEVRSGEDGGFRFEVEPIPCAGLVAWGGGHANTFVNGFSLEEDVRGMVLRLEPAVQAAGRVVAAPGAEGEKPGAPVPEAAVSLLQYGPTGRWIRLRTETTDAEGRFRTWGWAPGKYALLVERPGWRSRFVDGIDVPVDGLELTLAPAATALLEGEVLLPDGRTPAAGAAVRALARFGDRAGFPAVSTAKTDADGRFRIDALEIHPGAGATAVRVEADAGPRGWGACTVDVDPRGGGRATVTLVAAPEGVLRGRLVDGCPRGGPRDLEGVDLLFQATLPNPYSVHAPLPIWRTARTGPDGTFEVRGLPPIGVLLSLAPGVAGWELPKGDLVRVPDAPAAGTWELVQEVQPRARVTGKVVGPDGEPVPGARVTDVGAVPPRGALTGADGRFTLDGLATLRRRGGVRLRVEAEGFAATTTDPLLLEPASFYDGLLVTLGPRLAVVEGRVVDETGSGVAGAEVSVVPARPGAFLGAGIRPTATGPGGAYRLEVPAGAEIRVKANARRVRFAQSEVLLAGDPVPDLVLGLESVDGPR